jgi:hypothetical protein
MMSEMITREVEVSRIFLYEENPRHDPLDSQEDIIDHLCQEEHILELARSICEDGLNPMESVGLVQRSESGEKGARKTYEVWEGNRRICAIQLLNDPERAPAKERSKFIKLAKTHEPIKRVKAVVFDDPEKLRAWMLHIHGGEQGGVGRKKWNAEAKARVDNTQLKNKLPLTLLDVAEQYGLITAAERKKRLTTLGRYVSNPDVKAALGLDAADPTDIRTDLTDDDFKAVLKILIDDLVSGKISSRHNKDKIVPYGRKLADRAVIRYERVPLRSIQPDRATHSQPAVLKLEPVVRPERPKIPTRIALSPELQSELKRIENDKLYGLYYSICQISVKEHTQLVTVGIWVFIETLTVLAGRNTNTNFTSFYSHNRMSQLGFEKSESKTFTETLTRLAAAGNITKHHPVATNFDPAQTINDMETITPLLIKTLKKI